MLCAQSRIHRVPCRVEWQRQARLLAVLCCGMLGSTQDILLELAAARLLTLLLDPSSWACFPKCKRLALSVVLNVCPCSRAACRGMVS